jgi:hypothetical protein
MGLVSRVHYSTVSTKGRVADTGLVCVPVGALNGKLLPEAVTTICDEVVEEGVVVAQAVNMLIPIALTANRSRSCKRRRFLKPRKHSMAANIVAGTTGLELWRRFAVVAGTVTVSVVVAVPRASADTLVGAKAHEAPMGRNPEQLKAAVPLKAAFAVIVRVAVPVPPVTMIVELGEVMVKAGGGRLMMIAAVAIALLL